METILESYDDLLLVIIYSVDFERVNVLNEKVQIVTVTNLVEQTQVLYKSLVPLI